MNAVEDLAKQMGYTDVPPEVMQEVQQQLENNHIDNILSEPGIVEERNGEKKRS